MPSGVRPARRHLTPGGAVALNVAATPKDRRLSEAIATTLLTAFPQVWRWSPLRFTDVLVAFQVPDHARGARPARSRRAREGSPAPAAFLTARGGTRGRPAADRRPCTGGVADR
jgi:hypothetical protein